MKIFISHSSKDSNIAKEFSGFLEEIAPSIDVFCSSVGGSIKPGENFVKVITAALKDCDAFIPLITENYYSSKFCMVELGFAYAMMVQAPSERQHYIFPVAIPPIKMEEALAGTPLTQLEGAYIHNSEMLRAYLKSITQKTGLRLNAGMNKEINKFIYRLKKLIFEKIDIHRGVQHLVCKSQNVPGEDGDYLQYSILPEPNVDGYAVNFRAKPFATSTVYPDFLSFVYQFVDKINLYEPALLYEGAYLSVCINNYTNSISKIDIEIKHSDNNLILHRRTIALKEGENRITIPLSDIRFEALRRVSEICFVIKPSAYVEDEGMLQIYGLEIVSAN